MFYLAERAIEIEQSYEISNSWRNSNAETQTQTEQTKPHKETILSRVL